MPTREPPSPLLGRQGAELGSILEKKQMNHRFIAVSAALLLSGCVIAPTPYGLAITPLPPPPPPPVPVVAGMPPVVVGVPPVVVAPYYVQGWGYGYWYGNRFWPYHRGCHFYNGRYYGRH